MSVTGPVPGRDPDVYELLLSGNLNSAAGHPCFFCTKVIVADPALLWQGMWTLYLHRGCFDKLFIRLASDALELDRRQRGKAPLCRRDHARPRSDPP